MRYNFLLLLFFAGLSVQAQPLPPFRVNALQLEGLEASRTQRMQEALQVFEKVMNDTAFQTALLSLQFYFDVAGDPNRELSTRQIVEKIYEAKEFYRDTADRVANPYWLIVKKNRPLFSRHPAIGYGDAGDREVYTYTWFFDNNDLAEIAGHIAHEWSHKLGFQHLFRYHRNRDKTIPYAFGYLVKKYGKKYISQ